MNVGYYYIDLVRYYFCKWYVATTLIDLAYHTYQAYNRNNSLKTRIGSGMMALIFIPLGVNNALTPELADLCTYDDPDSYFIRMEFIIHAIFFGSMIRMFMKYTKGKEEKSISSLKYYI
jgi:hypothetical protein